MTVVRTIVVMMLVVASSSLSAVAAETIDWGNDLDLVVASLESDTELESAELDEFLSCHDLAVGGDRIRSLSTIDLEPERSWTETIHERFETIDGIRRPMRSRIIDFESGNVLGTTTVVGVTHSFSQHD